MQRLPAVLLAFLVLLQPVPAWTAEDQFVFRHYLHEDPGTGTFPPLNRSPLIPETRLVIDGAAQCVIAYPDGDNMRGMAARLATDIESRTGGRPSLLRAADLDESVFELYHVITFGNIMNNPLAPRLYAHWFVFADASFPGADAFTLHTICDPFGLGNNIVFVGASNDADLASGIEHLQGLVPRDSNWTIPLTNETHGERVIQSLRRERDLPPPDGLEERYLEGLRGGSGNQTFNEVWNHVQHWWLTGEEAHLHAWRAWVQAHTTFLDEGGISSDGFFHDKHVADLALCWDLVEESSFFDDTERHGVARYLYRCAFEVAGSENSILAMPDTLRWNHESYAALSLHYSGTWFQNHFDLDEGRAWRERARFIFAPQLPNWQRFEDARAYVGHIARHVAEYSHATGDMTFFESGAARKYAEFHEAMIDNMGRMADFGTSYGYETSWLQGNLLPILLSERDPDLVGSSRALSRAGRGEWGRRTWDAGVTATQVRIDGPRSVQVFPLHPDHYNLTVDFGDYESWTEMMADGTSLNRPNNRPLEGAFEKIAMRNGYGPDNQYLMIDGYSRGFKNSLDTGAIVRFTDNSRLWLVSAGIARQVQRQNAVNVVRNGRGAMPPPIAGVVTRTIDDVTLLHCDIPGWNGLDWTRSLVWLPEKYVVVIDEFTAREPGDYTIQTNWRTLARGMPVSEHNRLVISQDGERLTMHNAGAQRIDLLPNPVDGQSNWTQYEHADPVTWRIVQAADQRLERGDRFIMINLLVTDSDSEQRSVELRRDGEDGIGVIEDGQFFATHLSPEGLYFSDGETAGAMGRDGSILFPVNRGNPPHTATSDRLATTALESEEELPHSLTRAKIVTGEDSPVTAIATIDLDGDGRSELIVGHESGTVTAVDSAGSPQWTFKPPSGSRVNVIAAGSMMPGEDAMVFVGTENAQVFALDADGTLQWGSELAGWWGRTGSARVLRLNDIDGTGEKSLLAASAAYNIHCFDASGEERWRRGAYAWEVHDLATGDIDGDGRFEMAAGTSYFTLNVFDSNQRIIWRDNSIGAVRIVRMHDLDGDGRADIIAGGDDNSVTVYHPEPDPSLPLAGSTGGRGMPRWRHHLGDEIVNIHVIEEEGRPIVLAATVSTGLFAFEGGGMQVRHVEVPGLVNHFVCADMVGDGNLEYVLANGAGEILVLDRSGNRIATAKTGAVADVLVAEDGVIYTVTAEGVSGWSHATQ